MVKRLNTIFVMGAVVIGFVLYTWGQPLICTCGTVRLWVGSIFDSGNSQHIADWYTLSHIVHGVLIGLIWRLIFPNVRFEIVFAIAIATGVGWEIIEHTPWVLDAFRATTINQGYHGDSVLNAVADYVWMMGGFYIAARVPPVVSFLLILMLEVVASFVARDSLTLSTISLVYPIESLDRWQNELNPNS